MHKPDWYSRIMLTVVAALLLVVAGELRLSHQLYTAASRTSYPTDSYAPRTVALRHESTAMTDAVQEVRIVGYRYRNSGTIENKDFGTSYGDAPGLPVVNK